MIIMIIITNIAYLKIRMVNNRLLNELKFFDEIGPGAYYNCVNLNVMLSKNIKNKIRKNFLLFKIREFLLIFKIHKIRFLVL